MTIEGGTARGVHLTDARDNQLRNMTVTAGSGGSTANAIQVLGDSAGTLISDNQASAIGIALNVNASGLKVLRNNATGYALTGSDKEGPLLVLGDDNRIEQNSARLFHQDGLGSGVGVGSIVVYGDRNQLLGNTASDGVLDGIVVDSSAADTVLTGNITVSNGQEFSFGNGIRVEPSSASLGDNTANGNAQLGISAPAGVTDLGGNRASGNGTAAQCTGVVCQP